LTTLQPFNYFALGLIGFLVGGELKKEIFDKYGRKLVRILLCEGIAPFILVGLVVGVSASMLFGDWKIGCALALLMGAIASATDPATTTNVLNEYKTRGPLTATILGIVALDDALALSLFILASSIAARLIGQTSGGLLSMIIHPIYEIGGAVAIGIASGFTLSKILRRPIEKERTLAYSIGTVLFVTGLSLAISVDMLLAVMTLGVVVVNFTPRKSKEVFRLVEEFTPPIFVLFFVLVGAKLNLRYITLPILFLVAAYILGTAAGKMAGAYIGARTSKAPKTVVKYLPFSLFSQAGVAIGLSILAAHYFPGSVGNTLVVIITATTFISQIAGPLFTKVAIIKAGEAGLNITEEDLVQQTKAEDVMDKNPPIIYENISLLEILRIFSQNANLYYPVVDKERALCGIITVDNIKQTVMDADASALILAHDLMEPAVAKIGPEAPMQEAKELMDRYGLEYLPVVTQENKIKGFIERKLLNKFVSTKIMELRRKADSLG
jgi:NhaP-type Na+/H+ or K+/H+ antiporter